ncbi:hypothetical protein J6590_058108 [Homalodisca vitripennis]|nr:hypothetical protein J6590_058108 [Homalodisca vitripennis]
MCKPIAEEILVGHDTGDVGEDELEDGSDCVTDRIAEEILVGHDTGDVGEDELEDGADCVTDRSHEISE